MKRRIRLTESDLRRIVNESVRRVLRESNEEDDYVSTGYAGKDGEIFHNPKNGHVKKVKIGSKYKARQNKVGDYVSTGYADKNGEIFHNPKNGHIKRVTEGDLHRIIKRSVNRILKEAHLYTNDINVDGFTFKNAKWTEDGYMEWEVSVDNGWYTFRGTYDGYDCKLDEIIQGHSGHGHQIDIDDEALEWFNDNLKDDIINWLEDEPQDLDDDYDF